jgi:hypothetical protein
MNEPDDKIDFSPLDPAQDALRFERMVRATAARAREAAARHAEATVVSQLAAWARPALALAAAATLLLWLPTVFGTKPGTTNPQAPAATKTAADPAASLVRWAQGTETPPVGEVLSALGDHHG